MANASSKQSMDNLAWSGRRHLLSTKDLSKDEVVYLINRAKYFKEQVFSNQKDHLSSLSTILADKVTANLFYENSTRTRLSFELASKRLGMHVLNLDIDRSSVQKGESLEDTALTLAAMGVDVMVQRHSQAGSAARIAEATNNKVHVINAGEGITEHPTQALLDLFTMFEQIKLDGKKDLSNSKLVIVGDIAHSRVARSIMCFASMFDFGVHIAGPIEWLPKNDELANSNIVMHTDLDEAIVNADFVMALRIQTERMDLVFTPSDAAAYKINHDRLRLAKPSVKVMHPGPMNRGTEIDHAVAEDKAISLIECQVCNGVPIRMAVLEALCSTDSSES